MALVAFWHTLRDRPISRKFGIALASLFFFLSFFKAWRDQYQRANSLQSKAGPSAPIQVTVPVTVQPAQVVLGKEDKYRGVRERLAAFASEGENIATTSCKSGPSPECTSIRDKWERKVDSYLRANLDSSFSERWRHDSRSWNPSNPAMEVDYNVGVLNKLIAELK